MGYCDSLTSIYCYAENVPETGSYLFNNCPSDMVIYVPAQSVDAYKAAYPWNEYTILPLGTETVVCDAPQNLKVVVTKDDPNFGKKYKVIVTWDIVEGAEAYAIYVATQYYPDGMWMGTETSNEFIIGSDIDGELYFFVKTICNGDLGIESEPSERVLCVLAEIEFDVVAATNIENAGIVLGTGTYSQGDTVTLTATANEGYKFINWAENGEVISETLEYSFVVTRDVELIANFVSTEGIEELASSFNIYPNPVSDKLYIETEVEEVVVYDVYGRLQVTETPSHQGNLSVDVSDLNSGVYFVKVVTENGETVKRIIKG